MNGERIQTMGTEMGEAGREMTSGTAFPMGGPRVILGLDRQRMSGLRQALMAAGMEPVIALTADDMARYAVEGRGDLVLASASFRGLSLQHLEEMRALGLQVVVMASDEEAGRYAARGYVVVSDRSAPEQVVDALMAVARGEMTAAPLPGLPAGVEEDEKASEGERGLLVTICGLKGGSGKTTLALGLGYACAQEGIKTCAVSLDPVASDFQAYLGLKVAWGIGAAVDAVDLEQAVGRELRPIAKGFDVLCGPYRPTGMRAISEGLARRVTEFLRRRYQAVVMDVGNYPTEHPAALWAIRQADRLLVAITPELPAIYRAQVSVRMLRELRGGGWVGVVMCRYRRGRHHWRDREVEEELELPVVGMVPEDERAAARALDRQAPIVAVGGRAASAIRRLARQVVATEVRRR
jgi:Flp pilus assembly CpaE family ATPase